MITYIFAVFGVIFGSFINALVWRKHELEYASQVKPTDKKSTSKVKEGNAGRFKPADLSIVHGRSMCPDCHHTLSAKDLVPVLSWLSLKGRCRYCHKPISWQYPLVELVTALLFALTFLTWQGGLDVWSWLQLGLWCVAVVISVALAVYDVRWYILPTGWVYSLVGVAAAIVLIEWLQVRTLSTLWEPVFSAVLFYALFRALFEFSKGRWLGYGDVRLAVALGLLAGTPVRTFLVLFFASLVGTIVTLPSLLRGRNSMTSQIPFGPYLIAGALAVQLWGGSVLDFYQNLFI